MSARKLVENRARRHTANPRYEQDGELAAAVELRRYFAGIDSTAKAREMASP